MHERDEHRRVARVLRQRPAGRRFDADALARAEEAAFLAGARACRRRGACGRGDDDSECGGGQHGAHGAVSIGARRHRSKDTLQRAGAFASVAVIIATEQIHSRFSIEQILFNRLGSVSDNETASLFVARSRRSRRRGRALAGRTARATGGSRNRRDRAGVTRRNDVAPDRRRVRDARIRFSEATLRKYVQLGLLSRSVRVGRKGKHQVGVNQVRSPIGLHLTVYYHISHNVIGASVCRVAMHRNREVRAFLVRDTFGSKQSRHADKRRVDRLCGRHPGPTFR